MQGVEIKFVAGTLEIHGLDDEASGDPLFPGCTWDERTRCFRAPARDYASAMHALSRDGRTVNDRARRFRSLEANLCVHRAPRPFQTAALDAWAAAERRGVVVLPTGSGKSHVAVLAIDQVRTDTLVVAPTLDLVAQWHDLLKSSFRTEVGVVGGGEHVVHPLTVTTYDSAFKHMEHLGSRFGMIVFDECHHLPSDAYALAAQFSLAPHRLGLTATPERADGKEQALSELVGPIVFRQRIGELAGDFLKSYRAERILVDLTEDERARYDEARAIYRDFVRQQGIRMSRPDGWAQFVIRSSMSARGRRAMQAYQQQKMLAFAAPSKLTYVEALLHQHRRDRVLLFTERNATAYEMSERFLIPVITHQTKVSERSAILEHFGSGEYNVLATSKVLNEGVDMPAANVGIVVSGSGSVREHVQRLGRILRKQGDQGAILYELVAADTSEMQTSQRRRAHDAYQ